MNGWKCWRRWPMVGGVVVLSAGMCGPLSGVTSEPRTVSCGAYHVLGLRDDGRVVAWGHNGYGQANVPAQAQEDVVAIAAGWWHSVAVKRDGTVVSWGSIAEPPEGLADVVAISSGGDHALALQRDGSVVAWGWNEFGQSNVPDDLPPAVAVAGGFTHSVALLADGTVRAWGDDAGTVVPAGLGDVVEIAAGLDYSAALKADGTVVIWGSGPFGSGVEVVPAGVNGSARHLVGGIGHLLVVLDDGSVVAWGEDDAGQATVPDGTTAVIPPMPPPRIIPPGGAFAGSVDVRVVPSSAGASIYVETNGSDATTASAPYAGAVNLQDSSQFSVLAVRGTETSLQRTAFVRARVMPVAAGLSYTMVAVDRGPAVVMGGSAFGEATVPPMGRVVSLAGGDFCLLALDEFGAVHAWGRDAAGETTVPVMTGAKQLAAGSQHALALQDDGSVLAWGNDRLGQASVPGDLPPVAAVAAGGEHSLVLLEDRSLRAWGRSAEGQTTVPMIATDWVAIGAGFRHSLAVAVDGTVSAWGANDGGQCDVPPGLDEVVAVAGGARHSLALRRDGTVVAWGDNAAGQCDVPPGLGPVAAVAASAQHCVAVLMDGSVVAWGDDSLGQCAVGAGLAGMIPPLEAPVISPHSRRFGEGLSLVPVTVFCESVGADLYRASAPAATAVDWTPTAGEFTVECGGPTTVAAGAVRGGVERFARDAHYSPARWKVAAIGGEQGAVITGEGWLDTWGRSDYGQLNGEFERNVPFVQVDGGVDFLIALRSDGVVRSWGLDSFGQVSQTPDGQAVAVAAGAEHSLAMRPDGTLLAWGRNTEGQCTIPAGLGPVRAIAAGSRFSAALLDDGTVVCWGDNSYQQLNVPAGLADVVSIDAGFNSTIAVKGDGSVVFWGRTTDPMISSYIGPYPAGALVPPLAGPVLTPGSGIGPWPFPLTGNAGVETRGAVVRYALGGEIPTTSSPVLQDLELREGGILVCRSFGADGAAGPMAVSLGAYAESRLITAGQDFHVAVTQSGSAVAWGQGYGDAPVTLLGSTDLVQVSGGYGFVLGLDRDGSVQGWGSNGNGQLDVPADLGPAIGIAAGVNHSVALLADGTVRAWGGASGGASAVPAGLDGVVEVSAGATHSLALRADGRVVAWGSGPQAEVPATLRAVVAVAAGWNHSLALRADGTVVGWGSDTNGQATPPDGLADVVAVAAGSGTSVALKGDGTVVAWGIHVSPPADLAGVRQIAAFSFGNGMVLKADGTVVVWGSNAAGQTSGAPSSPVAVPEVARPRGVRDGGVVRLFCATPGAVMHLDFAGGVPEELSDAYAGPVAPTAPMDVAVRPLAGGTWGALRDLSAPATAVSFVDWVVGLGLPDGRDRAGDQNGATGIRNLLAYGLGRSPLELAVGELPGMAPSVVDPGAGVYRFTASNTIRGAALVVEQGSDLTGWETVPSGSWTLVQAGDDYDVYEVALPPEPRPDSWFIRIGVVEAP